MYYDNNPVTMDTDLLVYQLHHGLKNAPMYYDNSPVTMDTYVLVYQLHHGLKNAPMYYDNNSVTMDTYLLVYQLHHGLKNATKNANKCINDNLQKITYMWLNYYQIKLK